MPQRWDGIVMPEVAQRQPLCRRRALIGKPREYQCPGLRTHLAIWHLASLMIRIAAQKWWGR